MGKLQHIAVGRMIHLAKPGSDNVLCGSHKYYGGWKTFGLIATPEQVEDRHHCRKCAKLGKNNG